MVIVSGFLPVPLPMMIPFMGAQSLVIGKMFGEGFQYGKRKISAMPNDEFNKLTFQDMMSNARSEMQASIPTMQAALRDMQPLVETVVQEFFAYIKQIAAMLPEQTRQLTGGGELLAGSAQTKTLNLTKAERDYLVQQSQNKSGDLLGDILVKLGLDRFGQSSLAHSEDTTLNFGGLTGVVGHPSTVKGLSVAQAQADALKKQREFEFQQVLLKHQREKAARQANVQPKILVPQVSQVRDISTKKKAGQSQIMARKEFIGKIANSAHNLKTTTNPDSYKRHQEIMAMWQQKLINLLARYRF